MKINFRIFLKIHLKSYSPLRNLITKGYSIPGLGSARGPTAAEAVAVANKNLNVSGQRLGGIRLRATHYPPIAHSAVSGGCESSYRCPW